MPFFSDEKLKGRQVRLAAHSDYGTFTLLCQDDVGGLEVRRYKPDARTGFDFEEDFILMAVESTKIDLSNLVASTATDSIRITAKIIILFCDEIF